MSKEICEICGHIASEDVHKLLCPSKKLSKEELEKNLQEYFTKHPLKT